MESKHNQRLRKTERLTKSKPIELLFEKGEEVFIFPFKVVWQRIEKCEFPAKSMFVVPKRRFKSAVDRNHIRRLMKESYRINKQVLYDTLKSKDTYIYLAFIYIGKEEITFKLMQKPMLKVFNKIDELV